MTGRNEHNTNTNQQPPQDEATVHGRVHNSQNPAVEQGNADGDISGIDQQEGSMNNGESGGNLAQPGKDS